jgi:hypothetical protein
MLYLRRCGKFFLRDHGQECGEVQVSLVYSRTLEDVKVVQLPEHENDHIQLRCPIEPHFCLEVNTAKCPLAPKRKTEPLWMTVFLYIYYVVFLKETKESWVVTWTERLGS